MAEQKEKSRNIHFICFMLAILLSLAIAVKNQMMVGNSIPSIYYDDLILTETNQSVLDDCTLEMVHAKLDGLRIFDLQHDPQLHVRAQDPTGWTVHGIALTIKEPFRVDVECKLYYPSAEEKYTEDCADTFTLPAGRRIACFSIPEEVSYRLQKFRIDIDEPYEIEDIRIFPEMITGIYTPDRNTGKYLFIIYALVVFALAEVFFSIGRLFFVVSSYDLRWNKKTVLLIL